MFHLCPQRAPIDQVLGRELINQQLAERKKKLAEKTLIPCTKEKHFQQSTGWRRFLFPYYAILYNMYFRHQKEDYVDSPLPDCNAPILAHAAAAWNENGDPGVVAFIVTLSGPERQQLAEELAKGAAIVALKTILLRMMK